jgi:hypothetical protein
MKEERRRRRKRGGGGGVGKSLNVSIELCMLFVMSGQLNQHMMQQILMAWRERIF